MDIVYKVIVFFQGKMDPPGAWGWFHLMWFALFALCVLFTLLKRKHSERELRAVLLVYGVGSLLLELIKQVIWSVSIDTAAMSATWDYQWYAAPFQLCSMPMYVSILAAFLKPCKFRNALLSFIAYFTVVGSICTAFLPDSCFCPTIEVNIHTMYLHFGALALSFYLLLSKQVKPEGRSLLRGFCVLLVTIAAALALDIVFYKAGIVRGETFNMFFISPYFPSTLPVFDRIWAYFIDIFYPAFLAVYILCIALGGAIMFGLTTLVYHVKRARRER